jgi:FkbM family methyltransferase
MNLQELQYINPSAILDIGANIGGWAKQAKEVWPNAEIFMIEANKECQNALNEIDADHVICLLADKNKKVVFYQRKCGGTSTGDSIYRENTDWYNDENVLEVEMDAHPLDEVLPNYEFDLIKIDVQSAELDVLRGGKNIVSKAKYIIMEVPFDSGEQPYNIGAPTRTEVMDYMYSIGFEDHTVLEDIVHPILRYIVQQDTLFVRTK